MRIAIVEGTIEEVSEFYRHFKADDRLAVIVDQSEKLSTDVGKNGFPKPMVEEAMLALGRIPIGPKPLIVLRALRDAAPNMVDASTLHKLTNYRPAQFAGLMGAFGRRVTHTPDMRDHVSFFDAVWNETTNEWSYSLHTSVIEAMKRLKL